MRMVCAVSEPVLRKYHTEAKRVETPDSLDIVYHVDPDDRIVFVNSRWDDFARENDALDVLGAAVLGRTLTSFIAGDEILHLFALLMRDVRKTGRELTVPFRCDAPEARRRMELTIAPGAQANVVFRSRLLSSEPRPPLYVLDRRAVRDGGTMLRVCSWCNRGYLRNRWAELEEIVEAYGFFDVDTVPEITHGLCPDCERAVLADWLLDPPPRL
jgi:hypothetical protein